jgi:hypothetical protein
MNPTRKIVPARQRRDWRLCSRPICRGASGAAARLRNLHRPLRLSKSQETEECSMNGLIYLVGLVVVVVAVLSFFGLH